MKDWCHTNNILQVHFWGDLVQRRSNAQNVGNAHGCLSGIFNFRYNFSEKSLSRAQNGGHFENFQISTQLQFYLRYEQDRPKLCKKGIFMMMTSSMTSQVGLKVDPLYSFRNEIKTIFMITTKRKNVSSSNFLCIGIFRLWLQLYKYIFLTSLMTSPGHKIGQILKLIYLSQYLS